MKRDNRLRWVLIILLICIAAYYVYPTIKFYNLSEDEKNDPVKAQEVTELERNSIKRGLDLQGGVRLEMEIDMHSLVNNLATNKDDLFDELLAEAARLTKENNQDFLSNFNEATGSRNIRIDRYFDRERRLDENNDVRSVNDYLRDQADDGIQQSLNIIRNRIDQFGVAEPNIYKQGSRRIVIELPGLENIELAKELIGQTAKLEFRLEKSSTVYTEVFNEIDRVLKKEPIDTSTVVSAETDSVSGEEADTTQTPAKPTTATEMNIAELFGETDTTSQESDSGQTAVVDLNTFGERPFQSMLVNMNGVVATDEKNIPIINSILQRSDVKKVIPGDAEFLWSSEPDISGGINYYELLMLKKDAALGGEVITDARVSIGGAAVVAYYRR